MTCKAIGVYRRRKKIVFLADVINNHADELVADFQQFYGLDATTIGKDIDYERAGILCSQLPQASRVMREYDSSLTWDDETMILANIEYEMRVLLYGMCDKRSRPAQNQKY